VRDPCPGFEHEAGDAADGYLDPDAVLVHEDEGAVEHVQFAAFEVEDGDAVLERDAFEFGERAE
jgi:hypothetical protein